MTKLALATLVVIAGVVAACAGSNTLLHVGQSAGSGTAPALTNLRITDTGAFRTINTGDNRAVFP